MEKITYILVWSLFYKGIRDLGLNQMGKRGLFFLGLNTLLVPNVYPSYTFGP
jgi:hypothetical protein